MSWQLGSVVLLVAVLAGGFAWFERSRPPARVVALLAALAALAVAGRIAFAPVPNIVATTDIVFLTGYAIGGAPGFAAGALAALVSNFWLGQGPWTPWQMAGWGMVGLAGAGFAALTGRRLGRLSLAGVCALMGLAYGALLDFSVMVTYGGEQSLDRYLALSARAIPFNVAHALGNAAFALLAGPALVRMMLRFRARFEVRWLDEPDEAARPSGSRAAPGLAAILLIVTASFAGLAALGPGSARAGVTEDWLVSQQNPDGGFPNTPGGESSVAMTGWAALGLEASGRNPLAVERNGASVIEYLRTNAGRISTLGDLERTILVLDAAGLDARRFAGRDLVAEMLAERAADGSFAGQVNLTTFGLLALVAAGDERRAVRRAASWLRRAQGDDGGWGFQPGIPSDADSTGSALQALTAAGVDGRVVRRGVRYLREIQQPDGGWPLAGTSGASNSQSTAYAVQGLVAAGVDPKRVRRAGNSPLRYLRQRRAADGHIAYSADSDQTPVWVTAQGLLALERVAFPLPVVPGPEPAPVEPAPDPQPESAPDPAPSPPAAVSSGGGGPDLQGGGGSGGPGAGGAPKPKGEGPGGSGGSPPGQRNAGSETEAKGAVAGRAEKSEPEPAAELASLPGAQPAPESPGEEIDTATAVALGFGAATVLLAAGFVVYRRRLP